MNVILYKHIRDEIETASSFVLRHMPIGLSTDQIYEDIVGKPEIAQAFAAAAKYLPPNAFNKRITVAAEEWGPLSLTLRLPPSPRYPMYLMASATVYGPVLTRE